MERELTKVILVVEDDLAICEMYEDQFTDLVVKPKLVSPLTMLVVKDAMAAMDKIGTYPIDILVCDGSIPTGDGRSRFPHPDNGEAVMQYATERGIPTRICVSNNYEFRDTMMAKGFATHVADKHAVLGMIHNREI